MEFLLDCGISEESVKKAVVNNSEQTILDAECADKDGADEIIHVGPDGIPGTEDDFYEKDVDRDGEKEIIHVGPDGIH